MEDFILFIDGKPIAEYKHNTGKVFNSDTDSYKYGNIITKSKKHKFLGVELEPNSTGYNLQLKLYRETKTKYFFMSKNVKFIIDKL